VHNHTVQFYGDDGALLHELMSHIGKALARGSSAIIIATSAHIDGLARKLKSQGIDVARAKAESRYIALEASDVLSKFMVNGLPDRALFSDAIGQVIGRATAASLDENRRVVAFGEMVALLWAEGKCEAAMQLEKLWNELAKTYSFSLHCAYPMQGFSRQEMDDSVRKICAEHSGVVLDGSPSTIASEGHRSIMKLKQDGSVLPKIEWHEREEPFRLFVESVRDYAIFMLDPSGRIASWNSGAERIKGYRASEIIGQHFSAFYPKEDVHSGKPQRLLTVAESEDT